MHALTLHALAMPACERQQMQSSLRCERGLFPKLDAAPRRAREVHLLPRAIRLGLLHTLNWCNRLGMGVAGRTDCLLVGVTQHEDPRNVLMVLQNQSKYDSYCMRLVRTKCTAVMLSPILPCGDATSGSSRANRSHRHASSTAGFSSNAC